MKAIKRKADGEDTLSIITTSLRASNVSDPSVNNKERLRKSQRLRSEHGRGAAVDYNMKHHPMDDFLQPRYPSKRRDSERLVPEVSSNNDEEIHEVNEDEASDMNATSSLHRRRSPRSLQLSSQPIYSAKWHPLDEILKDNASSETRLEVCDRSKATRKSSESSTDEEDFSIVTSDLNSNPDGDKASEVEGTTALINPHQRRSARVSSSRVKAPNYDMKYHIMDSTLRPKAAAKRIESRLKLAISKRTSIGSVSTHKNPSEQPATYSPQSFTRYSMHHMSGLDGVDVLVIPAWSQLPNPYLDRVSLCWTEIQEVDRRVYLFQKGAPIDSDTLPQDWTNETFKQVLSDEGITALSELDRWNNISALKGRYESVRLGLQNFFKSEPEPGNKNYWTLSRTEGFDVYEMKAGLRYWRHQKEGVVKGITISTSPRHTIAPAKSIIANRNREAMDVLREVQYDDSERDTITETENSLIESMREGHASSSIMSDAALEELLLPAEQDFKENADHEVTADLILSDLEASESSGKVLAHSNHAIDKLNYGLTETIQINKVTTTSGDLVYPQGSSDEPRAPKTGTKAKKRKSRADFAVIVYEDSPGRIPLTKKAVPTKPLSPRTDIPKENLESDGPVGGSSQVESETPHTGRQHRATRTSSTGRVRFATTATPHYRSSSSSPASSRTLR